MPRRSGFAAVVALALVVSGSVVMASSASARRAAPAPGDQVPPPNAYLVADVDTGAVIAARNEHQPQPPASTMKLMTALVGLERLPLGASLRVSARAAAQPSMRIGMKEGETWPMVDALHSLLMVSANDAAYAIAENASGSVEQFAVDLQAAGVRLGMRDSSLKDPAGLDAEGEGLDGGSLVSAYDMAIAARNALALPAIVDTTKLLEYHFTGPDGVPHTLRNHDKTWLIGYAGATGLKPGFTKKASRTLVASATRGGRTCVAVVFGIYDIDGWATRLVDQCFATPVAAQAGSGTLPAIRVATVDERRAALDAFPRPLGAPAVGVASAGARASRPEPAPRPRATEPAAARGRRNGDGILTVRNLLGVLFVGIVASLLLRRHAVRERRRRRLARQRSLAEARRRGVIDVVDADRRRAARSTGTRAGGRRRPASTPARRL